MDNLCAHAVSEGSLFNMTINPIGASNHMVFCGDYMNWGLPDIENLEVHWNQRHNGMIIFTL